MRTILSLVFLIILIYCAWSGYKKGLILGILGLLAFIVSVYGANLLSQTYSGEVIDALRPFASGFVDVNVVDKKVRPAMGIDSTNLSVSDFFAQNPGRQKEFAQLTYEGMGIYDLTSEQMAEEAVAYAREHNDTKAIKDLAAIGEPVGGLYEGGLDALMVQRNYMTKFGGGSYKHKENIFKSVLVPFVTSGEYNLIPDLYRYAKGTFYCLRKLWPEVVSLQFDRDIRKLDVPVYLFQGDHDRNTPTELAKAWFDALEAPYKEYVPFHESAHSPIKEEPELWGRTLVEKLFS